MDIDKTSFDTANELENNCSSSVYQRLAKVIKEPLRIYKYNNHYD